MPLLRRIPKLRPTSAVRLSSTLRTPAGPPRLPAAQQAEFERLQRAAASNLEKQEPQQDGPLGPAKPEFEGDVNPKTGEVGGPKTEPLRWGAKGEWTYNGRATDF
jgi:hypothetical protein